MRKFRSILLIDDDEISNFLCKETIRLSGVAKEVMTFINADDALSYLSKLDQKRFPDLIFLDINMPGMDGWEFLEDFKKLRTSIRKKVTIIILSSSKYKFDVEKSKKFIEVGEYISKPLTMEILSSILNKYAPKHSEVSTCS